MKKCKSGYYYCNTDKKCKPIPRGYRVGYGGYLRKEKDDDDSKTKSCLLYTSDAADES